MRTTNKDNKKSFSGNSESYKRGEHPNSQSNLTPYEKGESGNPNGRPQRFSQLKDVFNKIGDIELWGGGDEIFGIPNRLIGTKRDMVHRKIWEKAEGGDMQCIMILERLGCLDE